MASSNSKAILAFIIPFGFFSFFWFFKKRAFRFDNLEDSRQKHSQQEIVYSMKLEGTTKSNSETIKMPIPQSKSDVNSCFRVPVNRSKNMNGGKKASETSMKNGDSKNARLNGKQSSTKNKSLKCNDTKARSENVHQPPLVNGVKNLANEFPALEAGTPAVNGKVQETNTHCDSVDISNSIFSRLQSYRIFVPAQHLKHNGSKEPCTTAENVNNPRFMEKNEVAEGGLENRTEIENRKELIVNGSANETQIVEKFEDLSLKLSSDNAVVHYGIPYSSFQPYGFLLPGGHYGLCAADSDMHINYPESLVSEDSGRGLSESPAEAADPESGFCMVYNFEIPTYRCGMMIGLNGRHVKSLLAKSGAIVIIKKHPYGNDKKICSVNGTDSQIETALKLIRKKFPEDQFPEITLEQLNIDIPVIACPKLQLPTNFEGVLTSTMTPGHFFLHQQTHPTFHQLHSLTSLMKVNYSHSAPMLENPSPGDICVATIQDVWYRAEVVQIFPDGQWCTLKFLDYGGYGNVPIAHIRQIRYDFMTLPFQAMECFLADVEPVGESWSEEAKQSFEAMAQGRVLQGRVAGYMGNVPCVYLLVNVGSTMAYINQLMVTQGFAKPISNQCSEEPSQQ